MRKRTPGRRTARGSAALMPIGMMVLVFGSALFAGSSLRNDDGTIVISDFAYPLWGMQLDPSKPLPTSFEATGSFLEPLAVRGLNTVGVSLCSFCENGPFFSSDGRRCDASAAKRFVQFVSDTNRHGFSVVLSTFSPDRRDWLESPAAYELAVETVARLLPTKHSLILVMGDPFACEPWPADCPGRLGDAKTAVELCRKLLRANPDAIAGLPAGVVQAADAAQEATPLVYAACTADAMAALVHSKTNNIAPDTWRHQVAVLDSRHLFRRRDAQGDPDAAAMRFANGIEQALLSVRPPMSEKPPGSVDDGLTAQERQDGWISLFDGRSLDAWTTALPNWGAWSVADGSIHCSPSGSPHAWLRTRHRFASFVLRLEYKLAADGNSGIFVWAPLNARASSFGLEIQLINADSPRPDKKLTTGAIYDALPPMADAARPAGEWNDLEIICKGSQLRVKLNGQLIQDIDADLVGALKDRLRCGFIGLQDHGCAVWFRRIRVKDLPNP